MKKAIVAVLICAAVSANAGLINWSGSAFSTDPDAVNFIKNSLVYMYQDVGNDNQAGWQNALRVNPDGTVSADGLFGTANDVRIAMSLESGGLELSTTVNNPAGTIKLLNQKSSRQIANDIQIYSVLFSEVSGPFTFGLVSDAATFNSGAVAAPGTPLAYNATLGGVIFGTQNVVIPEPATFGMMAVAGLGLFLARKKARG
jgi:hypothetical protein